MPYTPVPAIGYSNQTLMLTTGTMTHAEVDDTFSTEPAVRQRHGPGEKKLAHMAQIEQACAIAHSIVFGYHTFVLHWHLPASEWHHPCTELDMLPNQGCLLQIIGQLRTLLFYPRRQCLASLFEGQFLQITIGLYRVLSAHAGVTKLVIAFANCINQTVK